VFIKGNSDACITACQFVYGGKSAKSPWAQAHGGQALPAAGEHGPTIRIWFKATASATSAWLQVTVASATAAHVLQAGSVTRSRILQTGKTYVHE
jgi:hypothetical protein